MSESSESVIEVRELVKRFGTLTVLDGIGVAPFVGAWIDTPQISMHISS